MPDWKDFAAIFCVILIVIGAGALIAASQTFTIVRGKVLEKSLAKLDNSDGKYYSAQTLSVLIENDDRVFRIERGTVVKYAISDGDAEHVNVGSNVKLLVTSYNSVARVIGLEGSSPV